MSVVQARRALRGGGQFSPAQLAGLTLWLDPDRITGLADGAAASTWVDVSGHGNNASQATGANQPLYKVNIVNGHAVVRFDGTNDGMTLGDLSAQFPSAATLFVVATLNTDSAYSLYFSHAANDSWWRFTDGTGYLGVFRSARVANYPAATLATTGTHIWSLVSSASNYELFIDGASKGGQAASYSAGTAHQIGGDDGTNTKWLNGDIASVIAYNRDLVLGERRMVERYLANRYGVSVV